MNEELSQDIQRSMIKICDALSALEYAYRSTNDAKDFADVMAIINVATHSGMTAYETLSNAIDKVTAK
ncbi:hypothetical protein [Pantoea sp. NGS-ED-1003]|uniref:hypothetical protein n=1 Tax=Pantoea sp. NGS-ED-1003 TaxID=1526743 RepID=UPI000534E64A|nr:hypothetical protein [Pantoea sp. NGS-ED-1003]